MGEEMLHCSFEQIIGSMQLCLAEDPESDWVLQSLMQRALVFEQQEKADYEVLRFPEGTPDRNILVVLLHAEADGVRNGNSMVFNDELEAEGEGSISALFVAQRKCHPFWFGLKTSVETLLHERAIVFDKIKVEIAQTLEAMLSSPPGTRSELAAFRRESHARLGRNARETNDMHEGLIYRALQRSFGDALDKLIPKTCYRRDLAATREFYLQDVVEKLLKLTHKTFPEASSFEEEHARSLLLAVVSTYLVDQATRPVSTLN